MGRAPLKWLMDSELLLRRVLKFWKALAQSRTEMRMGNFGLSNHRNTPVFHVEINLYYLQSRPSHFHDLNSEG